MDKKVNKKTDDLKSKNKVCNKRKSQVGITLPYCKGFYEPSLERWIMNKLRFMSVIAMLAFVAGACSDDSKDKKPVVDPDPQEEITTTGQALYEMSMNSNRGCMLDTDCQTGSFCFQNQCVMQCDGNKLGCEDGYYCQATRGRCVTEAYLKEVQSVNDKIASASDMKAEEKSKLLLDLEFMAKKETNVVRSVIGQDDGKNGVVNSINIMEAVPQVATLGSDSKQTTQFVAEKSLGKVFYAVKTNDSEIPVLKSAKAVEGNGGYTYKFDIDASKIRAKRARLRDGLNDSLNSEMVEIVSNAGDFPILMIDPQDASGYYEGNVTPDILSGTPLPIRMYIETVPAKPADFNAIEKMTLYMPVSPSDIFSPESTVDESGNDRNTWVKVELAKEDAAVTTSKKPSFVAKFASNDFVFKGSKLVSADEKMSRSMRIEFNNYDASSHALDGIITDHMIGLYRENEIEGDNVRPVYHSTDMTGTISVKRSYGMDAELASSDHAVASEVIRGIDEAPKDVCTFNDIKKLIGAIDPSMCKDIEDEDEKAACDDKLTKCQLSSTGSGSSITLDEYNALDEDDRWFCVNTGVSYILNDKTRLSKILETVLTQSAPSSGETLVDVCGGINNFNDFATKCADSTCGICDDRPELLCGADLIARKYLSNTLTTDDEKADAMNKWLGMMRESYLAEEYLAWNSDTEIRKEWLGGATYEGTFAASILNDFNSDLLARYNKDVLGRQYDVMTKQFTQTTLEMLSQTVVGSANADSVSELTSNRNAILSEMAQTWQSVAEAMALSARRHDVLTQNDSARLKAARELRPLLFDLYFAGLIESKINLNADQGSLNGTYGANLNDTISKIASLDQSFESLVFMRDGEIFRNTSLTEEKITDALKKLDQNATNSVDTAKTELDKILKTLDDEEISKLQNNDNYLTALEALRAQLVSLCGYPADCTTPEDRQTCQIYTAPYFCGFSVNSQTKAKVDLTQEGGSDNMIKIQQVVNYSNCSEKLQPGSAEEVMAACGGNLALESNPVSMDGTVNSKAGSAILDYRQAQQEYETAMAEYEVLRQKVANNDNTANAYEAAINSWHEQRTKMIDSISTNLADINKYMEGIAGFSSAEAEEQLKSLKNAYEAEKDNFSKWKGAAGSNLAFQEAYTLAQAANNISGIYLDNSIQDAEQEIQHQYLEGILNNTNSIGMGAGAANLTASISAKAASAALGTAKTVLQTVEAGAAAAAGITEKATAFSIELYDREKSKNAADSAAKLQETLNNLKVTVSTSKGKVEGQKEDFEAKIKELEGAIQTLKLSNENQEKYERDLQELQQMRNDFANAALDLVTLAYNVKIKELARARALVNYLTIAQEAELVADQYNNKLKRYKALNDVTFSASKFFQHASDLELAEKYIEFARNDLNDYLTAIEYMTVRPFVEIRRSIYTARGTNDLKVLKEQLNDLSDNCGSGKGSDNTVTVSLRNRIGVGDADIDGVSAADRFHTILKAGALPVSAMTRYSVDGNAGDMLKKGEFYSGSFNLNSKFANLATSCNAKISEIRVRFVSKEGKRIRESGDAKPSVSLFYGGQSQLISCHSNIEAIANSIGSRTSFGKVSTFMTDPFSDGLTAGMYNVEEGSNYKLSDNTDFSEVTVYNGLANFPLMATYTIVFDPNAGENAGINWDNVADIEVQFKYTTGSNGQDASKCKYDI